MTELMGWGGANADGQSLRESSKQYYLKKQHNRSEPLKAKLQRMIILEQKMSDGRTV